MKKYCNHCSLEMEFVEYSGGSYAVLKGNKHAILRGNSSAMLRENSHAILRENSSAILRENSSAELWKNSSAELCENSSAILRGNSHATLRENSSAKLCGNSSAVLWENSHAQCRSPYAHGIIESITARCIDRHVGDKPISPKDYLTSCGIEMKNQFVTLYKSVQADSTNGRDGQTKYEIGKETVALDWDSKAEVECGKGLHLSPTVQQAMSFHDAGTYLACRVNIKDIASLPAFAEYPDKIRVRACVPLYQVDKEGNQI